MARYDQSERRALADLLAALGPDAPTLCAGWTTRDLAAHLIVRERRPDAAVGLVLAPLRGWGEKVRAEVASGAYPELVARVRAGPWWSPVSNPLVAGITNTLEFYVHHEDVRRAQPGWEPRELPPGLRQALWLRVIAIARPALRRLRVDALIKAPGYGETTAGAGGPRVRLVGPPGELALFLSGRQRVSRVHLDGPADWVDRLRTARLGI